MTPLGSFAPAQSRHHSATSRGGVTQGDEAPIPKLNLTVDADDNKLKGEVEGLEQMNKSKTSDKTVYTETGWVESCCNQCDQVVVDQDSVLKCASCKLFVHFLCSKLPIICIHQHAAQIYV